VAENGAVIYNPATRQERLLAPPPPASFVEALKQRKVQPLSIGRCIVSTWEPNETVVLEVIRDLGLELQIIFNKGAVMVLPPGINKAAGLLAALNHLGLSRHNVAGVGDAENDYAFLKACGCAAAVANALPALKEAADQVLKGARGSGVAEFVSRIIREDAALVPAGRHAIPIGKDENGREIGLEPQKGCVLIAGSSGIGKSTLATALTEHMAERNFEFCVLDPEGDYSALEQAITAGSVRIPPNRDEVLKLISKIGANVVVNTQALEVEERPAFFAALLPQISSLRARTGRPHWLIIDEAHHLLPAERGGAGQVLPEKLKAAVFITVHPEAVSPEALGMVTSVLALGPPAKEVVRTFCDTTGAPVPENLPEPKEDQILYYSTSGEALLVKPQRPRQAHERHIRKYAEGELPPDRSFYFRGPDNALNLRAQNLSLFMQIAGGVDDRTWEFHRKGRHYSDWFRNAIKDPDLAEEAAQIECDSGLDARASRERIKDAIQRRYTAPAKPERG